MLTQEALPAPAAIGIDYYILRWQDFLLRHADSPPDYYLNYGDKYCRRFRLEVRHRFTPLGQAWIDNTCDLLQQMLEGKRAEDPRAFACLEEDPPAFRRFAYSQHAAAYIRGGIAALPLRDLVLIVHGIDWQDLLTPEGLVQVGLVLVYLVKIHSTRLQRTTRLFVRGTAFVPQGWHSPGDLTGMLYYYYRFH